MLVKALNDVGLKIGVEDVTVGQVCLFCVVIKK